VSVLPSCAIAILVAGHYGRRCLMVHIEEGRSRRAGPFTVSTSGPAQRTRRVYIGQKVHPASSIGGGSSSGS
jgi:hypothetical protein